MRQTYKTHFHKSCSPLRKQLSFESLEDRRVLAATADVVFLMDLSGSGQVFNVWDWVSNEVFAPTTGALNPIATALANKGISDVRYGLAGFGSLRNYPEMLSLFFSV